MATFEILTDKQIYNLALQEWTDILGKLWTAFGKPLNPDQLKVYREALSDVPLGVLEHVVDETIKVHKFNSVPTLAELIETLQDLHPDYAFEESAYCHKTPSQDAAEHARQLAGFNPPDPEVYRRSWMPETARVVS